MNNKMKKDISEALSDGAVLFAEREGTLAASYTVEFDYVQNVFGINNLTEMITRTNNKLFSLQTNRFTAGKYIAPTKTGRLLMAALKIDVPSIRNLFPLHEFTPYFELFVQHARARDLDYWLTLRNAFTTEEMTKAHDTLQGFVAALREEGRSAKFKAKLRRFQRSANKNCLSLNRYLRKTLAQHSKINVRRCDLSYTRDDASLGTQSCSIDQQTAKAHREAFLKALRKSEVSKHLIGYAWKLEHSALKGFLYHLLLVLDEESIERQSEINDSLCKIWDEATEQAGFLVDCSKLHPSYKSEGSGLLDNANREAWGVIRKICVYMTQTDNHIKLKLPEGRVFGRAEVTQKKEG